jgi:hypothetical protein
MTLFPATLVKGGLVQYDPTTGKVLKTIPLQYNPDTLTRTLQVQASGETGIRSRRCGCAAPPSRRSSSRRRSTPRSGSRSRSATPWRSASTPQIAALESLVQPKADDLQANDGLAGRARSRCCRSRRR